MSKNTVNVGIMGLGFMGATHVKAFKNVPNARIAALCNPSGRNLDGDFSNVGGNIGTKEPLKIDMVNVAAYQDFDELLKNPDIDLIDICTPTTTHEELAIRALAAGKHVLLEKPMARTAESARRIVEAAEKASTLLMPAMCLRFWPHWRYVKEVVADGRFGRVLSARFRRVAEPPGWGKNNYMSGDQSGGALLDLHIHDTDFVQYCFGKPKSVFSTGYSKITSAVDHVVTQYQVEGGAIVSAEGCWAMTPGFGFNMSYTFNFEKATVDYDIVRGEDALRVVEEGKEARFEKPEGIDGYVGEINYLVECILNGQPLQTLTARDGLTAVEICEAEERSVLSGKVELI